MPRSHHEDWIMLCICDYAGQVRGKGFSAIDRKKHLHEGITIAPTGLMITAFGEIVNTPWGPRGEILMRPDLETETVVPALTDDAVEERFYLADLAELDGTPWDGCPRSWLKKGLAALAEEAGLQLYGAFEHEFHYGGLEERRGDAYLLDAMRLLGPFPGSVLHVLRSNGIVPELVHPEYGPSQFELSCKPSLGVQVADNAVRLREIVRAVARAYGHRAVFAPMMAPNVVGNGAHIHFSLQDLDGVPASYDHDAPHDVSLVAGQFIAGILQHMPALVALTAPSVVSYERLKPNHWSATYNNLGLLDREAGVRICPLVDLPDSAPKRAFNFEYRACDATASPYLALGAIVWAGLQGIRERLPPPEPTEGDPDTLSETEKRAHDLVRLPQDLASALDALTADAKAQAWMGEELSSAYLVHKQSELALLEDKPLAEQCRWYVEAY